MIINGNILNLSYYNWCKIEEIINYLINIIEITLFLIILYYILGYYKIRKLNNYFNKFNPTTYIISDLECTCKPYINSLIKCKKCRLNNVINLEDFTETIRFFKEIDNKERVNLILHLYGGTGYIADIFSKLMFESTNRPSFTIRGGFEIYNLYTDVLINLSFTFQFRVSTKICMKC